MRRQINRETGAVMDQWYDALAALWRHKQGLPQDVGPSQGLSDTDEGFDEARRKLDGITPKVHKYFERLTQRRRGKFLSTWTDVPDQGHRPDRTGHTLH